MPVSLERDFYERDTLEVAQDLLGKYLVHDLDERITVGKIVEVEAYIGPDDAAAHAYRGLKTARTQIMFGPGGYAYVYLIYGMYHCLNIVTGKEGCPEVVLIRALEPIAGIEIMKQRRKTDKEKNLCSGPGKLCQAMGINMSHYGVDLCGSELYLTNGEPINTSQIVSTPRINIEYSGAAKDYPWRYVIKGNSFVSKK